MGNPFGRQFEPAHEQATRTPSHEQATRSPPGEYTRGGSLARIPPPPLGQDPGGGGRQGPPCPPGVPWWFVPLGVAGVMQGIAWLFSRK